MRYIYSVILVFAVAAGVGAEDAAPLTFDFGPIISRRYDAHGNLRLRALGPLLERTTSAEGDRFWAIRPLYATAEDSGAERRVHDIVWPVASAKGFRAENSWRVLLAYGLRFNRNDPESRYRVWVLPFYFQGRDAESESYAALFPLGGSIHEILGRDYVTFALFPLFARSAVNEVETHDYLWPFISRTKGKGIYRFRFFPFYGQSEHRDKFEKKFVMWPIWTWARYKYPGSSGKGYIVFPLWGHIKLTDQESWMFLPPLFRFHRGARLNYVYAPWPIFQKSSGEIDKLWIWPLWGKKNMQGVSSSFLLWPIFWREKADLGDSIRRRFMALPFVYSETKTRRPDDNFGQGEVIARYYKLWPLISYRRDGDARRLRLLDLWPTKDCGPVERSWAPWWTLYSRMAVGENTDTEFLWGLYRSARRDDEVCYNSFFPIYSWRRDDHEEKTREWSILKGILGYKREGSRKSIRLLYFLRFDVGRNREAEVGSRMSE